MSLMLTFSLACYLLSLLIIVKATGGLSLISPVHVFVGFFTGYVYIWALIFYVSGEPDQVGAVSLPPSDERMLLVVTGAFFAYALGALVVAATTRFAPKRSLSQWRRIPIVNDLADATATLAVFSIVFLGLLLGALFFVVKGVPLSAYLLAVNDPLFFRTMSEARTESMAGSGYMLQGITSILPFGALLLSARAQSLSFTAKLIATAFVLLTIVFMFALTSRGHFAMFLILLFLVHQMVAKRVHWRKVLLSVGALLFLFTLSSFVKFGVFEEWDNVFSASGLAMEILVDRLGLGMKQMHALLVLIPAEHDYLLGRGLLWDAFALLPGADVGFNRWGFDLMYPLTAVPGNITPTNVGEWYANFGVPGVLVISAILGGVLQSSHQVILEYCCTASRVVMAVFLTAYLAKCSMNGLGAVLEPLISGVVTIVVFVLIRQLIGRIGSASLVMSSADRGGGISPSRMPLGRPFAARSNVSVSAQVLPFFRDSRWPE